MSYSEQQIADYITARAQRIYRYAKESDPMMAQVFAGEMEKSEWLSKKNEIKTCLLYPEGCSGREIEAYCKNNGIL